MFGDVLNLIFMIVGGLAMFMFGIHLTSDGLQKLAGDKMKWILTKMTNNRVLGATVGAGTSAILQSSSFSSVLVVGLASAGLLNLAHAASLIVGINLGATMTAQIIAFDVSTLTLPLIAVGAYMHLFTKNEQKHFIGQCILGLGLLFLGLNFMKDAVMPLKDNPMFFDFFVSFGSHIPLAVLFGIIATFVIQSSSAVIGITFVLATSGMLTLPASIAIVLGSNIGTTLTAQLAAFKLNRMAKRVATFHTVFNLVGVLWVLLLFGAFADLVEAVTPNDSAFVDADGSQPYISRHIANAHTIFNLANVVVFLFILPFLVKFVEKLIPRKRKGRVKGLYRLQHGYLKTPEIALMEVKFACIAMLDDVSENLSLTKEFLKTPTGEADIDKNERLIDAYQISISHYLGKIGRKDLTTKQSESLPVFMHVVNDIESMADCLHRIKTDIVRAREKGKKLSTSEIRTLENLFSELEDYLKTLEGLLKDSDRNKVIRLEEDLINFRLKKLDKITTRKRHMNDVLSCLHDFVRKMNSLLVMTREI